MATIVVCVYKGMTAAQIGLLTLAEIKKALSLLNELSSNRKKTVLAARLWTVLQAKLDGFKFSFEYMK
jgi:sulfur transfer protein SufE